jgi:hypothetical protein
MGDAVHDAPTAGNSVCFAARELWGAQAAERDCVYVDMWDDYLEAASSMPGSDQLDAVPQLPRDAEGPVFVEPWQAQAFALAVKLSEQGHLTRKEWATTLAEERKFAPVYISEKQSFVIDICHQSLTCHTPEQIPRHRERACGLPCHSFLSQT